MPPSAETAALAADLTPWPEVLEDEREYHASARYARDREYWRERLRDRPEAVTLSGRTPGWPVATVGSIGTLPRAVVARLEELGSAGNAGLPAVLFSAVALYLSRMTGSHDLVLGMPVAARTSTKLRRTTGVCRECSAVAIEGGFRKELRGAGPGDRQTDPRGVSPPAVPVERIAQRSRADGQ